jgi:mRNA interferase RelE/StbE
VTYVIALSKPALKKLDRIDRTTGSRVVKRLDELAADPYDPRLSKKLVSAEGIRSSRVGDWRIIYTVNEKNAIVYVIGVLPRGEAYRTI